MKKIDSHCHLTHKEYREELKKRGWVSSVGPLPPTEETQSRNWREYAEARIANMDKLDIERQVLICPISYTSDDEFNHYWAQANNDFLARVCRKYPDRFSGFATVPLQNVSHAIDELKRGIKSPGMVGVVLGSHVGEKMLDFPELMPFYEESNKMGLTIFIHPQLPLGFDKVPEYQRRQWANLYQFIGFLFDTTMAVSRMAFMGIFERYENINLIVSHLGGVLPFVCHSIDIMREEMIRDGKETPPKPPSEYFKRFYADTGRPLKRATLECALALFGEDHILFGSDMPSWTEGFDAPRRIIAAIEALDLPVQTEERIFYGNAKRLFKM